MHTVHGIVNADIHIDVLFLCWNYLFVCLLHVLSIKQGIHYRWTWTTGWGFTVGEAWAGWSRAKREQWDNCNRINNKIFKEKKKNKQQNKTK